LEVIKRKVMEDEDLDASLEEDLVGDLRHNNGGEMDHLASLFQSKCAQLK